MKKPPLDLFIDRPAPNVFVARRLTPADLLSLERDYPDWCQACRLAADEKAHTGEGLTAEEWFAEPDTVHRYCSKGCYRKMPMRRGPVFEFEVYGVRVCCGCDYAFPPEV
jgi:hypothetical protein